jgi:hypothetical protein
MTIGFSPFLTADVDETFNLATQWPPAYNGSAAGDATPPRLELIRRRVVMGYYLTPGIAAETAQRLVAQASNENN